MCPFEGWPNRAWPIQPISAKKGGMAVPCYVSPQKDTVWLYKDDLLTLFLPGIVTWHSYGLIPPSAGRNRVKTSLDCIVHANGILFRI